MATSLQQIDLTKSAFHDQRRSIIRRHRSGSGGVAVARALTLQLDRVVRGIYEHSEHPGKAALSLIALGGYGRCELCFGSDLDVMFLVQDTTDRQEMHGAVHEILHRLLDIGVTVGHSTRTVEECAAAAESDFESWTSLLERRYLCGDRTLAAQLEAMMRRRLGRDHAGRLVREVLKRTEERHRKYGNSVKLLEPNVKHSAGGLRDLHTILWLVRGTGLWSSGEYSAEQRSATQRLLRDARLLRDLGRSLLREGQKSLDVLLRVRNELHLQAGQPQETLEFSLQRKVAEALGYRGTSRRSSVERFMQDYYVAARSAAHLSGVAAARFEQRFAGNGYRSRTVQVDDRFALAEGELGLRRPAAYLSTPSILRALHHAMHRRCRLSPALEEAISRSVARLRPLSGAEETSLFRSLLNQAQGVTEALRLLNDLHVLERWIPSWKPMVAFFQHNVYHFYTADEHTLRVVETAEELNGAGSGFAAVYRTLPRRDVLFLACLLHDIAKPRRIGDHEVAGAEMAGCILRRLRYDDAVEDVTFLVRHHLLMEQVAFRRNLSDPQTIWDFAELVQRPRRLDYLYLLTYADLNAVNKNVWTDWKGMLLSELYGKTREVLNRKLTREQVYQNAGEAHARAVQQTVEHLTSVISSDRTRPHLESVDSPAYLEAFAPDEIAEHIRQIEKQEPVVALFKHQSGYSEVTVIGRDHPFALSQFCGVLTVNDANIFDAHVFTRSDGVIIDRFRVFDFISGVSLAEPQCAKIQQELKQVVAGEIDLQRLLVRHHLKWRRKRRWRHANMRIDVKLEEHPRSTIIDVFAADTLGFLYRITDAISRLNLDILFAKIATRADGIVDAFYVTDREGRKITDPGQREKIRLSLLKEVRTLAENELMVV